METKSCQLAIDLKMKIFCYIVSTPTTKSLISLLMKHTMLHQRPRYTLPVPTLQICLSQQNDLRWALNC